MSLIRITFIAVTLLSSIGCSVLKNDNPKAIEPSSIAVSTPASTPTESNNFADLEPDLAKSVINNDIETVKVLLEKGADPNIADTNGPPLISVAYASTDRNSFAYNTVIKLLLKAGANPNERINENGDTAISIAALRGKLDTNRCSKKKCGYHITVDNGQFVSANVVTRLLASFCNIFGKKR